MRERVHSKRSARPRGRAHRAARRRAGRRARSSRRPPLRPPPPTSSTRSSPSRARPWRAPAPRSSPRARCTGSTPSSSSPSPARRPASASSCTPRTATSASYNAFNWFYGPTWPTERLHLLGRGHRPRRGGAGRARCITAQVSYSVDAIAPKYCPDGTDAVGRQRQGVHDCSWAAIPTTPASPPRVSRRPQPHAAVQRAGPGGAHRLGQARRRRPRGGPAHLRVVHADQQRRPARRPGGHPPRHPRPRPRGARHGVRPGPHARRRAVGRGVSSWPLDLAGRWHGWIEVTRDGKAGLVGDAQAFGFWVHLPKELRWTAGSAASPRSARRSDAGARASAAPPAFHLRYFLAFGVTV